jgi:hypothetical protein
VALLMLLLMFCKKVSESIGLIFKTTPQSSKLNRSCVAVASQVSSPTTVIPEVASSKSQGVVVECAVIVVLLALLRKTYPNLTKVVFGDSSELTSCAVGWPAIPR